MCSRYSPLMFCHPYCVSYLKGMLSTRVILCRHNMPGQVSDRVLSTLCTAGYHSWHGLVN